MLVRMAKNIHPGLPFLARIALTYSGLNPNSVKASWISWGSVVTGSPLMATLRLRSAGSEYENQEIFSLRSNSPR